MKINAKLMSWLCQGLYLTMILLPFLREIASATSPLAAGFAAAPLILLATMVAVGMIWAAYGEKRLSGSALMFGRGALLSVGLLTVLVVLPTTYDLSDGDGVGIDRLVFGLAIWAMVVIPATGVMIAYHIIGDGTPRPSKGG